LRLLRVARDIHVEQYGGHEESFRTGRTLDLVAAGQRAGLPTGCPSHEDAVEWLEDRGAIEVAQLTRRVAGGPIYRITRRGVEMLRD